MQIDNFISYLLEIGVLDIENKQILLNIYNNIKNKANNEIENDIIKISFFSYIEHQQKKIKNYLNYVEELYLHIIKEEIKQEIIL